MTLEDVELGIPCKSQYGEYIIILEKDLQKQFPEFIILRLNSIDGHIRRVASYNKNYSVTTGTSITDKFVDLLFNNNITDFINVKDGKLIVSSQDLPTRKKEIFDVLFYNWK